MARPRKIESPEMMDALVDAYVWECRNNHEPLTLSGMILALGLFERNSLDKYATYSEDFAHSVKRAKLIVAHAYEINLRGNNVTGSIFALKNFGWSDRQQLEHTSPDGSMTPTTIKATDPVEAAKEYQRIMGNGLSES